jgi:hypothetical protein
MKRLGKTLPRLGARLEKALLARIANIERRQRPSGRNRQDDMVKIPEGTLPKGHERFNEFST